MSKNAIGRALARSEAKRDIWQEVLDGVRKVGGGRALGLSPIHPPCGRA
jgi:hypothetical protein